MKMREHLIAFRDGSYKKLIPIDWKHSQWIHYTLANGSIIRVNPANVNYIQESEQGPPPALVAEKAGVYAAQCPPGALMGTRSAGQD